MLKRRDAKVYLCFSKIMMGIFLHGLVKTSVAGSNLCEVTRSTVQVADDCPDSEENWKKAAARKNCAAYASQCDEPERLVYHCVINAYVNQTLEVCAYAQNIVLGQCTSYSASGNIIQQNSRTNCAIFTNNSCPMAYRSDEAYKYPGCYQLIKKSPTVTDNPASTKTLDTTFGLTIPTSSVSSNTFENMLEKEEKTGIDNNTLALVIGLCIVPAISVVFISVYCVRKKIGNKSENIRKGDEGTPLKQIDV